LAIDNYIILVNLDETLWHHLKDEMLRWFSLEVSVSVNVDSRVC